MTPRTSEITDSIRQLMSKFSTWPDERTECSSRRIPTLGPCSRFGKNANHQSFCSDAERIENRNGSLRSSCQIFLPSKRLLSVEALLFWRSYAFVFARSQWRAMTEAQPGLKAPNFDT